VLYALVGAVCFVVGFLAGVWCGLDFAETPWPDRNHEG